MIKTKTLLENWKRNEYDEEAVTTEYKRLSNGLWAMYENGLITLNKMKDEQKKLNKAYEKFNQ